MAWRAKRLSSRGFHNAVNARPSRAVMHSCKQLCLKADNVDSTVLRF